MKPTPYPAPHFSLPNQDGDMISRTDFDGRWLVVYFYPKDDTPGCTTEACSIRDATDDLQKLHASVVGISKDDAKSHTAFRREHNLPFDLLSDSDGAVIEAYGAWGKKMFSREGIQRKTFLINPEGDVVKAYGRVTPTGHGAQIAEEIRAQQAASGAYGAGTF